MEFGLGKTEWKTNSAVDRNLFKVAKKASAKLKLILVKEQEPDGVIAAFSLSLKREI